MTASPEILQHSLESELGLVRRFIDILQAEAKALEQADHGETLDTCTQQKNACIEQLLQVGQTRENSLRELGYSADQAGLEAAAAAYPKLNETSTQLFDLGKQAAQLNADNGVVIDTYLIHTQQALQAMRQLVGGTDLYDASGRPGPRKGGRSSITAG